MSFLNNLPAELIDNICARLHTADIVALRHSDRKLAFSTTNFFLDALTSIKVSCSDAGLFRLKSMVSPPMVEYKQEIIRSIKHVAIHTPTYKDVADMAESQPKDEKSRSLRAYARLRKTLIDCLNQFPNLEAVTATNEVLNNNHDRYIKGLWWSPELDPLHRAGIWRESDHPWWVRNDKRAGHTYGYEVILSMLPTLRNHVEFNLVVDYALHGCGTEEPFCLERSIAANCRNVRPNLAKIQQQMFGVDDLNTQQIYEAHINELTLKNNEPKGGTPQWKLVLAAKNSGRLTALTVANMGDSLECAVSRCIDARNEQNQSTDFPLLNSLNFAGEILHHRWDRPRGNITSIMLDRHSDTLTTVRFADCTASRSTWKSVLKVLPMIPGLRASNVSIVDCRVVRLVEATDGNAYPPPGDAVAGDADWFWEEDSRSWHVHTEHRNNPAYRNFEMGQQGMRFSVDFTDTDDGGVVLTDHSIIDRIST
jgi:hypothetical protein